MEKDTPVKEKEQTPSGKSLAQTAEMLKKDKKSGQVNRQREEKGLFDV